MKRIAAPFLLASLPMSVNAAPDKVQYELQERCAKRAEQIFSKDSPTGLPTNLGIHDKRRIYQSHYNPTLNKCFSARNIPSLQKDRLTVKKTLLDVNSNRNMADFRGSALWQTIWSASNVRIRSKNL